MKDKAISDCWSLQLIYMEPVAPAFKPPEFEKELFPDTNFIVSAIITQRLIFADFSCSTAYIEHLIFISLRWSYKF